MTSPFSSTTLVFVAGFLIGFNIAFFCAFLRQLSHIYNPLCPEPIRQTKPSTFAFDVPKKLRYEQWLDRKHVTARKLDMDVYLHGPKFRLEPGILESEWLQDRVHVTCVVFVDRKNTIEAIKSTWGNRCNRLYFIGKGKSSETHPEVIFFEPKMDSSWHLLCETLNRIWREGEGWLEWAIFVKEDTMVLPENLRLLVAPLDFEGDFYLGHAITMWRQKYNMAQAGYVLSRGSVKKLVAKFNGTDKCAAGGKYWKMEDFYLGQHLESLGIHPSDTRDSKLRGIFHGYALQTLMWGMARPTNYWTKMLYPIGSSGCCSPLSVTFIVSEADKLYTMNYLLHHLHVYTSPGIYGNKPAPTPIPEEEVWKTVLREEFGLNNITEMSHEQYYNLWRSIYSEPEVFIAKNFNTMPPVFRHNATIKSKNPSLRIT